MRNRLLYCTLPRVWEVATPWEGAGGGGVKFAGPRSVCPLTGTLKGGAPPQMERARMTTGGCKDNGGPPAPPLAALRGGQGGEAAAHHGAVVVLRAVHEAPRPQRPLVPQRRVLPGHRAEAMGYCPQQEIGWSRYPDTNVNNKNNTVCVCV